MKDLQSIQKRSIRRKSDAIISFLLPVLLQGFAVFLHSFDVEETLGFGALRVGETIPLCEPLVDLVLIPKLLVAQVALPFGVSGSEFRSTISC